MTHEMDVSGLVVVTSLVEVFFAEGQDHFQHLQELRTPRHRHGSECHPRCYGEVVAHRVFTVVVSLCQSNGYGDCFVPTGLQPALKRCVECF